MTITPIPNAPKLPIDKVKDNAISIIDSKKLRIRLKIEPSSILNKQLFIENHPITRIAPIALGFPNNPDILEAFP